MFQNWVNLISNFKLSSSNILFCLLAVSIFAVLRIWSQLSSLHGNPDFLSLSKQFFLDLFNTQGKKSQTLPAKNLNTSSQVNQPSKSRVNSLAQSNQRELNEYLPADQPQYSIKPVDILRRVDPPLKPIEAPQAEKEIFNENQYAAAIVGNTAKNDIDSSAMERDIAALNIIKASLNETRLATKPSPVISPQKDNNEKSDPWSEFEVTRDDSNSLNGAKRYQQENYQQNSLTSTAPSKERENVWPSLKPVQKNVAHNLSAGQVELVPQAQQTTTSSQNSLSAAANRINVLNESVKASPQKEIESYTLLDRYKPAIEEESKRAHELAIPSTGANLDDLEANDKNKIKSIFQPLLDIKGISIQRLRPLLSLKRAFEDNNVIFLIGPTGSGKAYLSSLYARELNFNQGCSVISFSFNQNVNSLQEALRLILIEQLKVSPSSIDNPVQTFFKIVANDPFLIVFNNIELLPLKDLILVSNCNLGASKALFISSSLSVKSLNQVSQSFKACVIELAEIEDEDTHNFFLERVPLSYRADQTSLNKLNRIIKGNPLALNLFCFLAEDYLKHNPTAAIEGLFKEIENLRVVSDRRLPINLCKILTLSFKLLSDRERNILFLCSHLPLESFSNSLVEHVFNLSPQQTFQTLEALQQKGLIQNLCRQNFQEPRFVIHSTVKDFIYKEFKLVLSEADNHSTFAQGQQLQVSNASLENQFNEILQKVLAYFSGLLDDKDKLNKENTIFVCAGLSYAIRLISGDFSRASQYGVFLEKTVNYFYALGLLCKIKEQIVPIYEDNLNSCKAQEARAFWQRLLGLCLMMMALQLDKDPNLEAQQLRAEKIRQMQAGIDLLEQALAIYANNFAPSNCLQLHSDLGNAYLNLAEIIEDKTVGELCEQKLIKAIEHFKKAVQLQNVQKNSIDYIICHISLGNAYLKIYQVKPNALTLHLSIQILARAIKSYGKDLDSAMRSSIHQNIANALRNLANHEDTVTNLQAAINEYKAALAEPETQNKAIVYNSLGCCFWKLAKFYNPAQNIQTSINAYRRCLAALVEQYASFSGSEDTLEYAVTLNNIGTAYKTLASLQEAESNFNFAIKAFSESLRIAERRQEKNLIQVINKHLLELNTLLDNLASRSPEKKQAIEKYQQEIRKTFADGFIH